jgi:L-fucose isomerase-like protein
MSMFDLMSSARGHICSVLAMHALQLASGTPSALLDWNNNYGDHPNKAVLPLLELPKHSLAT